MEKDELMIENTDGDGGQIVYVTCKTGISIKRYRGIAQKVVVPSHIDGQPVTMIEKKAFLSCKTVSEIILPDTVDEIGDWAFAHTEKLKYITLPDKDISIGKELFLGCKRLREIIFKSKSQKGIGRMLAMAVMVLHDYFLLDYSNVGTDTWMARWDDKLLKLLELDDLDGFEELWTCGEEDYEGKEYDIKSYPVEKRKMKMRIVYFRLMHPYKLSDSVDAKLKSYLKSYTKGAETSEAWDIIMEEHPNDIEYYKIFMQADCVTGENFEALLKDMVNVGAEIKASMIRYNEEHFLKKDAFEAFALDW